MVEDQYRREAPDTYLHLVQKYSHSGRNAIRGGPDMNPAQKPTVSNRLAVALHHLHGEGLVSWSKHKATGYWTYNGPTGFWGRQPAPAKDHVITWASYATSHGLDPDAWVLPGGR